MLAKWNPFSASKVTVPVRDFDALLSDTDTLLRRAFFDDGWPAAWGWAPQVAAPATDLFETESELTLKMDLPGFDPQAMNITVEGDVLTVRAERKAERRPNELVRSERSYGQVARSFALPNTVDPSKCEARFEHGVLTLTLPKREEAKPRSVHIKVQ